MTKQCNKCGWDSDDEKHCTECGEEISVEEKVEISKAEHERLLDAAFMLQCLYDCGVSNWAGFDDAFEMYDEDEK